MASFNADVQAAIHGEMDSETDLDDTVGDSEEEDSNRARTRLLLSGGNLIPTCKTVTFQN